MEEFDFDLLVCGDGDGPRTPNPHVAGSESHREWESAYSKARQRFEQARHCAEQWNRSSRIGDSVLYRKGALEGSVVMRTASAAYVFGTSAAIDLEHIGLVLLQNVEVLPARLRLCN